MAYQLEYFSQRVLDTIESWPADVLADYAWLVELLLEHGPNLRLPFSRAFGDGLFELRPHGHAGQTPETELKLARKRLREIHHG